MHALPLVIGEHLYLDMPRLHKVSLHQHPLIAETCAGLPLAALEGGREISASVHATHAAAPPSGAGLDEHRIADLVRHGMQKGWFLVFAVVPRRQWHTGLLHQRFRGRLRTHGSDRRRWRPDKYYSGGRAALGKPRVFGQEAVARM